MNNIYTDDGRLTPDTYGGGYYPYFRYLDQQPLYPNGVAQVAGNNYADTSAYYNLNALCDEKNIQISMNDLTARVNYLNNIVRDHDIDLKDSLDTNVLYGSDTAGLGDNTYIDAGVL
jgi:hypothetical protein